MTVGEVWSTDTVARMPKSGVLWGMNPWKFLPFLLLLISTNSSVSGAEELCNYGSELVPRSIYQRLIGWSCYQEIDVHNEYITYVCRTTDNSKIPCLKVNGMFLDFKNMNSSQAFAQEFPPEQFKRILDCFTNKYNCSDSYMNRGVRIWEPGTDISLCSTETRNKFHISMLSISLVVGVPAIIISSYFTWTEKGFSYELLKLQRNLITSVILRSFITLLIQSEVILPYAQNSTVNEDGIPALATFETWFLNTAVALWLVLNYFLLKSADSEYKITPKINLYTWIAIGIAFGVTLLWIIVVASTQGSRAWIGLRDWDQWINDSVRIVFLLAQIYSIVMVIVKIVKQPTQGGDTGRRIRLEALYVFLLTPIFVLQFALNAGTPTSGACEEAFFYTFYFIDGIQGALVCLFFFYIDSEVVLLLSNIFGLKKITDDTPIKTLDSLKDRANNISTISGNPDVVYSSVLSPERYEKTLQLYSKQNAKKQSSNTLFEGDIYLTCDSERKNSTLSEYYDADSIFEFHDVIDSDYENSKKTNEKLRKESIPITPVHNSKFATINRSSISSNDSSSVELDNRKRKNFTKEIIPNVPNQNLNRVSSDSTSDESVKNYPMTVKVDEENKVPNRTLKPSKDNNLRNSTDAVKGSSSEESLQEEHHAPYPIPPLRKKRLNAQEGTKIWLDSHEERQSYPPTIKVTSPSIDHQKNFEYLLDKKNLHVPTDSSSCSSDEEVVRIVNSPKILPKQNDNASENPSSFSDADAKVQRMEKKSSISSSEGEYYINQNPEIPKALPKSEEIPILLQNYRPTVLPRQASRDKAFGSSNVTVQNQRNPEVDKNIPEELPGIKLPELPTCLPPSDSDEDNLEKEIHSDLNAVDKRLNFLFKNPQIEQYEPFKSEELKDYTPNSSFDEEYCLEKYDSKDIDTDFESSETEQPTNENGTELGKDLKNVTGPINAQNSIMFYASSSSSSDSSDNEEVRDLQPVFNQRILPTEKAQIIQEPDSSDSEEDIKKSKKIKNDDQNLNTHSLDTEKVETTKSESLPDIYEDLRSVPTKQKSLPNKKESFSKMFSNHRNKLLSSKSENDIINDNRLKFYENSDNLSTASLQSPNGLDKKEFQPKMSSYEAVENLNDLDVSEDISPYSTDLESDYSTISSDTVKKTKVSPKMVLRNKSIDDWEPQKVAFKFEEGSS